MPASEREARRPSSNASPSSVSMDDLLASCAAASAVSTPPRNPDRQADGQAGEGERVGASEQAPRSGAAA